MGSGRSGNLVRDVRRIEHQLIQRFTSPSSTAHHWHPSRWRMRDQVQLRFLTPKSIRTERSGAIVAGLPHFRTYELNLIADFFGGTRKRAIHFFCRQDRRSPLAGLACSPRPVQIGQAILDAQELLSNVVLGGDYAVP